METVKHSGVTQTPEGHIDRNQIIVLKDMKGNCIEKENSLFSMHVVGNRRHNGPILWQDGLRPAISKTVRDDLTYWNTMPEKAVNWTSLEVLKKQKNNIHKEW